MEVGPGAALLLLFGLLLVVEWRDGKIGESVVAEGTVKFFNAAKGFGFVTPDDGGAECFVHYASIRAEGYRTLTEGQRVSFTLTETPKGRAAVDVTPLP